MDMVELDEPSLLVNRRGQDISIQDSAAPIRDRNGKIIGAVMVFHDVSKERRLRRALAYQASHDALTGLISLGELAGDALRARAEEELAVGKRKVSAGAVTARSGAREPTALVAACSASLVT